MKRKFIISSLAAVMLLTGGCGSTNTEGEIQIPILDGGSAQTYSTAAAELYDLSMTASIGADVSYAFADTLTIDYDTNLISYNVTKNDVLKEGDVIAAFDSSALDYEYRNQQILTDNAYSRYLSSGSTAARLEYEEEQKKLDLVQYKIDQYTIRAPYDCIVSGIEYLQPGVTVTAGTKVCTVAKPDEICVTVKEQKDAFAFGKHVDLKFGTSETYSGTVVMTPENKSSRVASLNNSVVIRFDDGELERISNDIGNIAASGWVTVIVETFRKHNALCIPTSAIMKYSGNTYCYLDNGGTRTRVPIEVGDTVNDVTIVLSGLSEGDTVSF